MHIVDWDESINELVEVAKRMAYRIKLSHGGWWESYASAEEIELVRKVDALMQKDAEKCNQLHRRQR